MNIISVDAYLEEQPQRGERYIARFSPQDTQDHVLYSLAGAYISGKYPLISPLYNNGKFTNFLKESSGYQLSYFYKKNGVFVFEPKAYYEDCAFLCHPWSYNLFHWVTEGLPQLFLFESIGFAGKYIITQTGPFIKESLALLGISTDRLIEYTGPLTVKNLYVAECFNFNKLFKFTSAIDLLRNTFLGASRPPSPPPRTRLYIARRHNRKIANEKELINLLEPYGFQTLYMEDFSFAEQIAIAAKADTLLGPHGAGFVYSLFMPPRSTVVELFSRNYVNFCYMPIVRHLRHKYIPIPESFFIDDLGPLYLEGGRDITPDLGVVQTVLQGHLGG